MGETQPLRFDPRDEILCLRAHRDVTEHDGAVLPPIVQASLFRQPDMGALFTALAHESSMPVYARGTNPTVAMLEETLAELERGAACRCFASGMGAIAATLTGLLDRGDHIVFAGTIYGPTIELAERLSALGIAYTHSDARDAPTLERDLRPETRLIYLESPGSMVFDLLPIAAIADLARSRGIVTVLDNSVATPLLQKPITLGIDLVVHSCSKYIGGHSDVIGGALIGDAALIERVFQRAYMLLGAVMAPFTAWLLLRGLMTLPTRLARHYADALAIATHLSHHARVAQVFHPTLTDDRSRADANRMRGHAGLFSFALDGDFNDAVAVANRLTLFGKAVSWGGPESLVITGHKRDPGREAVAVPAALLRLSVGFEGSDALIADLDQALG